jgi:hypothetical protein
MLANNALITVQGFSRSPRANSPRPIAFSTASTILREAHEAMAARGLLGHEQDFLDSLAVMEEGMRHFYVRAMAAKQTKQPDAVIDAAID